MHPILSFVFIALGLAGFAVAAYLVKGPGTGYYQVGSELIVYGLLVAAGIGLNRARPFARVLTLALLRAGAWAIFFVPIGMVAWLATLQHASGNILRALGGLLFGIVYLALGSDGKAGANPLWYLGGALLALAALSFVCSRLYRRVQLSTAPAQEDERLRVNVLVVVLIAIAFGAQKRITLSDHGLPDMLRSAESKAQSKKFAEEALAALVGMPFAVEGGKGLLYLLANDRGLVHVDVASGRATLTDLDRWTFQNPIQSVQRPASRFSPDGTLLWSNNKRELADFRTGRRITPALEQGWDQYLALGFVDRSKRLILFDAVHTRVIALDTASALPVFSVDVTPPGGFSSDEYRQEFRGRIGALSVFSPDRARLMWFYLDTLYVLDTASGALDSLALPSPRDARLWSSRDSAHVVTMKAYDKKPGSLVDVAAKSRIEHGLHGVDLLHFSRDQGLIVHLPRPDNSPDATTLARWALGDLATPVWSIRFPHRHARVSADGKRLYAYNTTEHRLETADLSDLKGDAEPLFKALPVALPPGKVSWVSYFPEGEVIVAVQSPMMAIARLDASGGVAGSHIVDFTAFRTAAAK